MVFPASKYLYTSDTVRPDAQANAFPHVCLCQSAPSVHIATGL